MGNETEAADQVVSMSLRSIEVMAKISGEGAKHLAVYLYAALQGQKRTKGRIRLESLLRSGKELKVFAVKNEDLPTFCKEAKRYGVLYCALRDKKNVDGLCDVMVRAEDASKINRIVERFRLATVDTASIKQEIETSRAGKSSEQSGPIQAPEHPEAPDDVSSEAPNERGAENLLDELLGKPELPREESPATEQPAVESPEVAPPANERLEPERSIPHPPSRETEAGKPSPPSAPTSERNGNFARAATEPEKLRERVSVRQLLREIREENRAAEKLRRQREQEPPLPKRKDRSKSKPVGAVPGTTTVSRKRGKAK